MATAPATLTITVNGRAVEAEPGASLLDVLRREGVAVPTLCHDDRLTPYGGCRLCVVERSDGRGGLIPACSTPVQPGMTIATDTPAVIEARRRQLQLLVLDHRLECPVCERSGDCRLQDLLYEYGAHEEQLPFERRRAPRDERSPVIVRDSEKCILCGRCVRLCDEVQGVAEIGIINRGLQARVATLLDRALDCEFCGQCVNACPVGALTARPYSSEVPAWLRRRTATTCSFCSCGCQVEVETYAGALQRVTADPTVEPNRGKLCAKGWLGWDIVSHPERLTAPLVRRDSRLVESTWEEALSVVTAALEQARDAAGAVVGVGSARLTSEDAYLFQQLLRDGLGTPHVACGPVGGVAALVDGVARRTGVPRSTATWSDLRAADLVLVLGADPTRTHPLVKTELVQAVRQRGRELILAHSLSGGLEHHAAVHLSIRPGSEADLLRGVAAGIVAERGGGALEHVDGYPEWAASLSAYSAEHVAEATGVTPERLTDLSGRLRSAASPVAVLVTGTGLPGDEADAARAAIELTALLDGTGGRSRVLVLGETANVQGVVDSGLHPSLLPGWRPADNPGWPLAEAFARAAAGEVELLYLLGEDPACSWPAALGGRDGVAGARFVVAHDAFLSETCRRADVVLPVAVLGERTGSLVGADGVVRGLERVIEPPASLPSDGQLLVEIARRLGASLPAAPAEQRAPAPPEQAGIVRLSAAPPPTPRPPLDGLMLDASPQLFHSGLVTSYSAALRNLAPPVALHLAPGDAAELGVGNGEWVRVTAGEREILLRARLDRRVRAGSVVAPWYGGADTAGALVADPSQPTTVTVRRSR